MIGWVDYDSKTSTTLEKAFLNGKKDFAVDDERYVDFKVTLITDKVALLENIEYVAKKI